MSHKAVVKVQPGGYYASAEDIIISTLLGSCVSACIHDIERGIGGLNHFLLPEQLDGERCGRNARYGANAMELLINSLLRLGAHRQSLQAKVFGAGQIISSMTTTEVGQRNAEFVLRYLEVEKIPVIAQDLGGPWPRRVRYHPYTGRVELKRLPVAELNKSDLVAAEAALIRQSHIETTGAVELFS